VVALARLALAHGGAFGLAVELGAAVAITVLLIWALWKGRRATDNDEGRPDERPS
jgi:membrane protein implicated in regulation of membrane protease activity